MLAQELNKFYEHDLKKYNLESNKEFLDLFKRMIISGYIPLVEVDELQRLIDYLTSWYEIKYPEKELMDNCIDLISISPLQEVMSISQLLYRLSYREHALIECKYRGDIYQYPVLENEKTVSWNQFLRININHKNITKDNLIDSFIEYGLLPYFIIDIDINDGKVIMNSNLSKYINDDETIYISDLLEIFSKYEKELDLSNLKKCLYNHECDLKIRKMILQFVALKLLYSKNTIPERGYLRALKFIEEFNKYLNLNLSKEEVSGLINYNNDKVKKKQNND